MQSLRQRYKQSQTLSKKPKNVTRSFANQFKGIRFRMSDRFKLQVVANEVGKEPKEILAVCQELGIKARVTNSSVSGEEAESIIQYILNGVKPEPVQEPAKSTKAKTETKTSTKKTTKAKSKTSDSKKSTKSTPEDSKKATAKIKASDAKSDKKPAATKAKTSKKDDAKTDHKKESVKQEPVEKIDSKKAKKTKTTEKPKSTSKQKAIESTTKEAKSTAKATKNSTAKPKQEPTQELTQEPTTKSIKAEPVKLVQGIRKASSGIKIIHNGDNQEANQMQGFRLLKKKNPRTPINNDAKNLKAQFSYGKTKVANDFIDTEEAEKKKAKAKKKTTSKKDLGVKLSVLSERDSFDFGDFQEEQVTFMPDLTVVSNISNYEYKPKKDNNKTAANTQNRPKGQKMQGIARVNRKKRRYDKKDHSEEEVKSIAIEGEVRLYEFAESIGKTTVDLITLLTGFGVHITKNDFLSEDLLEILGEEYDIDIHVSHNFATVNTQELHKKEVTEVKLQTRAPIVSIMGHVDHGKTTLLDTIRKANVAAGEVGGITQQVNAYSVNQNGKIITFVDTPGHESFKAMRGRGAALTDIVIIVVAADDGVMPTTKEAVKAAQHAKASIVVAVNKIDKETANIDKVKGEMAELGLTAADWGGEHEFIPISALKGEGVDDLLDTINIQAELLELKANELAPAKATILESTLEKGRGVCTSLVITDGVLKLSDFVIAGSSFGRIKAIFDDKGQKVKQLQPSQPGTILGLDQSPSCGDILTVIKDDKKAREISKERKSYSKQKEHSLSIKASSAQDVHDVIRERMLKALNVIVKADREGSLEAIKNDLLTFRNEEVKTNILNAAVGEVSDNDLILAGNNALLITFNVKPSAAIKKKADKMGVQIHSFEIIYELFDFVKDELSKLIAPKSQELIIGSAEVRQLFQFGKEGVIAGSMVLDGQIKKDSMVKVLRDEQEIFVGKINALKRFKDDVKEVAKGYDCGISLLDFNDFKEGDVLQSVVQENIKMKFKASEPNQEHYYEQA